MKQKNWTNSQIINTIALGFSLIFLISAFVASLYTREWGYVFRNWYRIMITPCPLVTDYLEISGLASAMLNAGACGMACFFFMIFLKGDSRPNTLAGYFLVVAHCFYGLNFFNMWPCFLAPFLYLHLKKLDFKGNLHICMFATSFSPFISELLFRYTQRDSYTFGILQLNASGILLTVLFSLMIGFIIPAILPGAHAWHKGYNLYNGGLAFGLFGFFLFNFLFCTMGFSPHDPISRINPVYESFHRSYRLYANLFFLIIFAACIVTGYFLNGKTFRGYANLMRDTGHSSDFSEKYGMPLCLVNIGCHGALFLLYINLTILFTVGVGFTGPTIGVVIASLTFTAMGQHPKNVWPILFGYQTLYFFTAFLCFVQGRELSWSLSTQGYINGVAFATGLCPIVGRYGIRAGTVAGFMCASMCTATSALHGGFVLYNGGLTTGITALILLPILEHYQPHVRQEIKSQASNLQTMFALAEDLTQEIRHAQNQIHYGETEPAHSGSQKEAPPEKNLL
ncbi:MAG: DUF1576 domain-containing protein [Lachnospiraceae bacterium]|jgi:hypothetical protein|nr:DUF1576 domain-containing protein [Lachnospiraceae bacterium]